MERYIGKRQIGEGGWEKTFHCLIQTKEKRRFTVPPAVALLNNISSGILWRIFSQTGIFAGFSLHIINFAVRISKAAMDRGHYIFRVLRNSFGVRHSSGGCSVAQKDAAQLRRLQRSSEVQRSSQGAAKLKQGAAAQKGAAQLRRMQLCSEGADQLRLGAAQLS